MTTTVPATIHVLVVPGQTGLGESSAGPGGDDRLAVTTVADAEEALDSLAAEPPDCVVSGYDLPDRTGVEFCETVRETYPDLPFVLATARGSERIASDAIAAGVTAYIPLEDDADEAALAARIVETVQDRGTRWAHTDTERGQSVFFEEAPLGGIEWGEEFRVARMNEAAEEILGYSEAELRGEPWETLVPESDRDQVEEVVSRLMEDEGGYHSVNENVRKDGERIVCEWHNRVVTDDEGEVITIFSKFQDVTEQTERQAELERYQTLVESAAGGVFMQDEDGTYSFVNSHIEDRTGYDRTEVIGEDPTMFMPAEDIEAINGKIAAMLEGERDSVSFETEITTKEGRQMPVEGQLALVPSEEGFGGTVGMIRDISDRKARERELQRQKDRLEEFASVVSHDLRNPLNVVQGRLDLAKEECDSDHLEDATRAVGRMQSLIDDLLTLAREGERVDELQPVALADLSTGCWQTVNTPAATLDVTAEGRIRADPARLKQLLENLYRNAVEHGGEAVTVTVCDTNDGFFVADDGEGIPPEQREEIFDAGYTTAADGTGFGLSIVEQVADAHGWTVSVRESDAGGARFEFGDVEFV